MNVLLPYTQDATFRPNIVWEQREYFEPTNSIPLPSKKEERALTDRQEKGEDATTTENLGETLADFRLSERYSEEYISYNTRELISNLIVEFSSWRQLGTEDALIHISKVKDMVNSFESYLHQEPKHRLLLSTLQLLFQNNKWEKMTAGQINLIISELKRFQGGELDWEGLEKLSRQLYSAKMRLLKSDNHEEKKENQ